MSKISYNNFGLVGKLKSNLDLCSGRYKWMNKYYSDIINDISIKLELNKNDKLFDIGCGSGKIVNSLSHLVKKSSAIDHPNIINSINYKKINFIKGDILKIKLSNKKFDKILIYSLVHYLKNTEELFKLIRKSFQILNKNGILLIGDIPNIDKKKRFKNSINFKKINNEWQSNNLKLTPIEKEIENKLEIDKKIIKINDKLIYDILKKYTNNKSECYLLKQNKKLPMNNTRVDILIKKL
jgi:ubiquinone/menaquinone biosynthesis C-methylase UbiE